MLRGRVNLQPRVFRIITKQPRFAPERNAKIRIRRGHQTISRQSRDHAKFWVLHSSPGQNVAVCCSPKCFLLPPRNASQNTEIQTPKL